MRTGTWCRVAAAAASLAVSWPPAAVRAASASGQGTDPPARRFFYKDSRAQLALARAQGKREVSMVIAAVRGGAAAVVAEVERLGGNVRYRFDEVDYLRARVPLEKAEELVRFPAVHAADVDILAESIPPYLAPGASREAPASRPAPAGTSVDRKPSPGDDNWPPPRPDLTLRPIFSPLKDLAAADWRAEHPTFDGRGVTVAVLDGNIDFLLPEFQVARQLDGTPTRKVIDVLNGQDPREAEAPQWVAMSAAVPARHGRIEFAGESWRAPREGSFRIGVFDPCRFPDYVVAYFRTVLNRPGAATDVEIPIGVLWDEKSNEVWVDANQNRRFDDEKPMTDFHERYDWALLGTDDPETPVRESFPFVVQTDREHGFVAVNVGLYGHSTMVSGALLASRGENGLFNGVAPGARLVSIFEGSSTHGLIESMIRAFSDPRIDAVLLEQNVFIAMPYVLNDGRFTGTVICSRLIEKYRKPFFSPANNAFGLNTTEEHGMARYAFGVGAYESSDNFLAMRAVRVAQADNLHWVGSFGPSGNGAIQPDILSPSEVLTTNPASRPAEDGLKGVFGLPPGYGICGGTSCATPIAAGAVSLLISGAKQSNLPHDPSRLHQAVTSTARRLSNFQAYQQGNGLIQVAPAWRRLTELARETEPIVIESQAPVKTAVSRWLEPPDTGPGIYEREGWRAGAKGERTVRLTRTSGPARALDFRLRWLGNDGTFAGPASVRLPLRKPVAIRIGIAPRDPGVHSAILELEGRTSPGAVYRMLHTVVATEPFASASKWTLEKEVKVDRPGVACLFFDVPPGVGGFQVTLKAPKETIPLTLYPPDGREDSIYLPATEGIQTRAFASPMPGVWMVVLASRFDAFTFDETRPAVLPPTPVTVTASLLGVGVTPNAAVPGVRAGDSREISYRAENRYGAFAETAPAIPLSSTLEARETIGPRGQSVHAIQVPEGTGRLAIEARPFDENADIDLYLFDCTGKACEPRRVRVGPEAAESLSIDKPAAGAWKLVVDAARTGGNGTEYVYREHLLDPRYGALFVPRGATRRDVGASWESKAHVWIAQMPPPERRLFAVLPVLGEGITSARQAGPSDLNAFEAWKPGFDAVALGGAAVDLSAGTETAAGSR